MIFIFLSLISRRYKLLEPALCDNYCVNEQLDWFSLPVFHYSI
ncbi:MAG: hypothetical protein PHU66_07800 [Bacteroidaceae bacterium]|nr:hypothetical protein [Bacteroidaceae bacterium]